MFGITRRNYRVTLTHHETGIKLDFMEKDVEVYIYEMKIKITFSNVYGYVNREYSKAKIESIKRLATDFYLASIRPKMEQFYEIIYKKETYRIKNRKIARVLKMSEGRVSQLTNEKYFHTISYQAYKDFNAQLDVGKILKIKKPNKKCKTD